LNKEYKFDPYKALKSILEVTSSHTGKSFIEITAEEIKKLFNADLVFITSAIDYNPTTKVKIIYSTNKDLPKEFQLERTPCKLVYQNKIIQIDKNIKYDFEKVKNSDFESFYGIPITNHNNICIGHISIFSNKIRKLPPELEDIAIIYARKIERELKRVSLETENERIRQELEELSITDSLTKLYNRRYFIKICDDIFAQIKRGIIKAILSYIDIDDFKKVNDKFGHEEGDIVLKQFANIVQENSRKGSDYLFRIGGEEFCIITINSSLAYSYKHIARIMENTIQKFENTKFGKITLSVGIVEFNKKFNDYNEIINLADKKMYAAKKAGKNTIVK
jgi:diguanylate cyclase (GGDEF)-like protein